MEKLIAYLKVLRRIGNRILDVGQSIITDLSPRERMVVGAAVIAGFIVFNSVRACRQDEQIAVIKPVKTIVVGGLASGEERTFTGETMAFENVDLSFEVGGRVLKIPVKEGDDLKKGALIAQLDARDYEAELQARESEYQKDKADLERYRQLWVRDAVPVADLQTKERNYDVAESKLKIAQKAVADTKLMAPFDGEVGKRYVEEQQDVKAKQPIIRYLDLSRIKIVVPIPESLALVAKEDKSIQYSASFETMKNKSFPLTVYEYGKVADAATRTFPVTFVMPPVEGLNILPGMTAVVTVKAGPRKESETSSFDVPVAAIFTDADGKQAVWVLDMDDMKVHKQLVTVGPMSGDFILVTSGLKAGDRIVTAGTHFLQEDMEVRLLDETREQANP